jgi:hypothetical protein
MAVTLEFSPMEHATVVSLVALGIAVMQNDEQRGQEHIAILSSPGVEAAAEAVLAKLVEPLTEAQRTAPTLQLES